MSKLSVIGRLSRDWNREEMIALLGLIERQVNGLSEGALAARYNAMTAAPTTGTWAKGDIVYNSNPTSTGYIGFVCTAAGTPGTWRSWGLIA